ncbi:hypothetical protein [Amycolatopsis keratiniphila]|uniref:Uncharacterized protein n=1 Tax=Amycolatopsis keratiniphila subsp. keratiniphila TaxID=227715 RepID=A0A1W2LV10_9PSEU|nr:hypothetical protein [Amycolatopsis keratiniphila]ONF69908.1 hypothetical protein AVR91_0216695 [Amycolatopsis keratiniphila subsp. keratiniphila]
MGVHVRRLSPGATAAAAGVATVASILTGVVGNLATNTVGEIGAGWKPVIWTTLGVLAAAVTFSAIRNALRSERDPTAPDAGSAERPEVPRGTAKRMAWQAKAMLVVWATLATLGLIGTVHALTTPHFLDIGDTYISSFRLVRNTIGGWEVTTPAGIAIGAAVFAWGIPPFVAGAIAYRAVPRSAGGTARTLAACVAFAGAGWSVFAGSLACLSALRQLIPPGVAVYLALLGVLALTFIAWGWAGEAGLGAGSRR